MKTRTVKEMKFKNGRPKLTIKTTFDDETGIETHDVTSWHRRRRTHTVITQRRDTGEILTVDKHPIPRGDSIAAEMTRLAAKLIVDLARDERVPDVEKC
jgi:hypothetical protein